MRDIWNPYRRLHLSKQAISDLQFLTTLLTSAPVNIWRRPVSLVIPRDPHFISLSDVCDNGLGGYSTPLNFQWRDLITSIYNKRELHINSKEFIALFINVYLSMISFLHLKKSDQLLQKWKYLDGFIFEFLCDNTGAISWMTHSSRYHDDKTITRLSHALSLLIYKFNSILPANFTPKHIPGEENNEADALSRPSLHPTYSVYPVHKPLKPLRLPSKLTSLLGGIISGTWTKEQIEKIMTKLLKVDVNSLKLIVNNWEYNVLA